MRIHKYITTGKNYIFITSLQTQTGDETNWKSDPY